MGSALTPRLCTIAYTGLVAVAVACKGGKTPDANGAEPDHCEQVAHARLECKLPEQSCETSEEKCRAGCLAGWGCAELENVNIDPGIVACFWSCAPKFTCDDGLRVYARYRCDGVGDCRDSEDELGCPPTNPPPTSRIDSGIDSGLDSGLSRDGGVVPSDAGPRVFDGGEAETVVDAGAAPRWDGGQL